MQSLTYTSRGLRRRGNGDHWEAVLSHTDPVTGEVVSKVEESFDAEMSGYGDAIMDNVIGVPERREPAPSFSVDQLKAMLAAAEEKEASHGRP